MSAAPQSYVHPRVEPPRTYYIPPTRAVPVEPAPAPRAPARRRLPVVQSEEDVARAQRRRIASAVLDAVERACSAPAPVPDPLTLPATVAHARGSGRGLTVSMMRFSKRALMAARHAYPVDAHAFGEGRPRTFEECCAIGLGTTTPCPFVSCAHHLFLDVDESNGSIKVNFPEFDVIDIPRTCGRVIAESVDASVDRAAGLVTLDRLGELMNLTRERVRQIETKATSRLRRRALARPDLREFAVDDG